MEAIVGRFNEANKLKNLLFLCQTIVRTVWQLHTLYDCKDTMSQEWRRDFFWETSVNKHAGEGGSQNRAWEPNSTNPGNDWHFLLMMIPTKHLGKRFF